jgi:hypothetical protein
LSKEGGLPLIYRALAQRYLNTLHRREQRAIADVAAPKNTQIAAAKQSPAVP